MTSLAAPRDRVVGLARGMRDLVRAQAAESERLAHAVTGDRRRDVGQRPDDVVQPRGRGRARAVVRRDDRDLDRNGLARRLIRLDRHRQPAVVVRRGGLPSRRGLRRGLHRQRQSRHDGRPVRAQRAGRRRRRRLPADRGVELRLGHRALRVRRRRLHPDGRRRDALDQRGHPRADGGPCCRATEIVFTDGWNVQGLKGTGSYDYNVADVFVPEYRTFRLFTREPLRGTLARRADGHDGRHRRGSRGVGARGRQEHARRRRGTRRHQVPDE